MQFTTTLIAAVLAVTAAAIPQSGPPAEPIVGQPSCPPIADKPQSILIEDVWKAWREIDDKARKFHDGYPCTRNIVRGDFIYGGGGSVLVKTSAADGRPHCIHPREVAAAIKKIIGFPCSGSQTCANQWGYVDIARVSVGNPKDKKFVKLEEMASDRPSAVGK